MLPKFSMQVLHLQPENIVFVLAPVGVAIFAGLRSVEYFSDRYNKLVTISGAYVLMAASLIALGLVHCRRAGESSIRGHRVGPMNEQAARIAVDDRLRERLRLRPDRRADHGPRPAQRAGAIARCRAESSRRSRS